MFSAALRRLRRAAPARALSTASTASKSSHSSAAPLVASRPPLSFLSVPVSLRSTPFPYGRVDPATLFNALKQAFQKKNAAFSVKYFSGIEDFLSGLYRTGFIAGYVKDPATGKILVQLRYSPEGNPSLFAVSFLSRPSFRRFVTCKEKLQELEFHPFAVLVLRTPEGVEFATKGSASKHGGELLARLE